ncbi:hypothetical protein JXB28_04805 [Candidatus Woesearchaeota archaeon]|nr:hypothetical protein [Candidatus Woesearchaeota archaeon]
MALTRLIQLINAEGIFPQEWAAKEQVDQESIDAITEKVVMQLSPQDIVEHNLAAYSNSVEEYGQKQSNKLAVPELPLLMGMVPNQGLVLDLGAGHLRDSQYMIDPGCREALNRPGMISPPSEKRLRVIPLEGSTEFLKKNMYKLQPNLSLVPLVIKGDFMKPGYGEAFYSSDEELETIFTKGKLKPVLDGIWSCTGYLVHMVPGKLNETTAKWAEALKPGGIFSVSYIKRKEGKGNIKLLASKSALGEIKIFSHYTPKEVDEAFTSAGMRLIDMASGSYNGHGYVMDDFFGSSAYRKE